MFDNGSDVPKRAERFGYLRVVLNMRPDEHKKRKNAQYKKAHGIDKKSESVKSTKQKENTSLTSQNDGTRGKNEESRKEACGRKEQPNQMQKPEKVLTLRPSICQFVASSIQSYLNDQFHSSSCLHRAGHWVQSQINCSNAETPALVICYLLWTNILFAFFWLPKPVRQNLQPRNTYCPVNISSTVNIS